MNFRPLAAGLASLALSSPGYAQAPNLFDSLPGNPAVRMIGPVNAPKQIVHLRQMHENSIGKTPACFARIIRSSQQELSSIYDTMVQRGYSRTLLDEGMTAEYLDAGMLAIAEHKLLHERTPVKGTREDEKFTSRYSNFDLRIMHGDVPIAPADSITPYEMTMQAQKSSSWRTYAFWQNKREDATVAIAAQNSSVMLRYGAGHRFDRALQQYNSSHPTNQAQIIEITPASLRGSPCGVSINRP